MIDIEYIRSFFPPSIARESRFDRYMLKEYLQLLILDHLTTTPYINKVAFIGGTNLRLIQGIDRFSDYLSRIGSKALEQRVIRLLKVYGL